jgi:xylulokinase
MDYPEMNREAESVPIGSEGLLTFPFGNGAERILGNLELRGSISGLDFNRHSRSHILRSAQEGIVFALKYGFEIMENMGMEMDVVRAGEANMFLSPLFREAFVNTNQVVVELYNTDGSQGAARGAGIGGKVYSGFKEAFNGLKIKQRYEPDQKRSKMYNDIYVNWLNKLERQIV